MTVVVFFCIFIYIKNQKRQVMDYDKNWARVDASSLPDMKVPAPGPKFSIGWMRYHCGNAFDFITNVAEGKNLVQICIPATRYRKSWKRVKSQTIREDGLIFRFRSLSGNWYNLIFIET